MRFAISVFLLLMLALSSAEDFVAINSVDGRDVLSGVFYANVKDVPVKFVPKAGDSDIFAMKVGSGHDVLLIQGATPISGLVENSLKSKNNTVELYASANAAETNLDLAVRSGATSFIIVDSAYSDSAVSVLPYAAMSDSYVILVDKNNAERVHEIVVGKTVIIYGHVDAEVEAQLEDLNPQHIGDGKSKYADNVLIAKKTMDEFDVKRIVMVDGTFIEDSMLGSIPIIFTGRIVPDATYAFVKEQLRNDEINEALLIGGDLAQPVYDMRERIKAELLSEGINKTFIISVKFAQVVPATNSGALILDTFPLPAYRPSLQVSEVVYESEGKNLMVTLENLGDGPAYYVLDARILLDGSEYAVVSVADPALVERGVTEGIELPLDLSTLTEGNVSAELVVKYGAFSDSLEDFAYYNSGLATITYVDDSDVSVQSAKYDREQKTLLVTYRNKGPETAYSSSKVQLIIDGTLANVSSLGVREIDAGSLLVDQFPIELSEDDISANKNATVFLKYGARKGFLKKEGTYTVVLEEAGFPLLYTGLIVLALLIAGYYLYSRDKGQKK
ncbi:MAG: hypothetical protein AB1295_05740 [Candidatus Micrarchaeota archaeon]